MGVQILQKTLQTILVRDLGSHAGNSDAALSGVLKFAHKAIERSAISVQPSAKTIDSMLSGYNRLRVFS
jgi:hypothetical protein